MTREWNWPGAPGGHGEQIDAYVTAFRLAGLPATTFLWQPLGADWRRVRLEAGPQAAVTVTVETATLPYRLTARELDVLTLLAIGLSNTEIGARLVASPRTVSTHVEHILAKLGQSSRTGAAAMAVERGLLRLPIPGPDPISGDLAICRIHAHAAATGATTRRFRAAMEPVAAAAISPAPAAGRPLPARRAPGAASETRRPTALPWAPGHQPMPASAGRPLRIGSAFPLAGLAADDGRQMRCGASLAIAQINARGGIAGRPIEHVVVDADIFSAEGVRRAFGDLFDTGVEAVTSGYFFPEQVAADLASAYGAPYLHAMTSQSQAEIVRDNNAAFRNVFQVCPTEAHYGPGFVRFLDSELARDWRPRQRRIAFIDTDLPSAQLLSAATVAAADRSGWEIADARVVPAIGTDWAAVIADLERLDPAAVMIAQFLAGELATFQRFAAARLPGTLIYAAYAPSVPEFLEMTGPAAEGLVWATVTGTYDDAIGQRFRADYAAAFGRPPGWSHAGIAYDEIHLIAQAWRAVADQRDFRAVSQELRHLRYRGVNGAYFLDNAEQSGLSYPDSTPDPSLGQAHLVLQVQDGDHKIISPVPYAESHFRPPRLRSAQPSHSPLTRTS